MVDVINNITTELYRIFDILNDDKFDGVLSQPVITIQFTRGTYGHFTTSKIWKNKNDDSDDEEMSFYEININPNYFNVREPVDIVCTLLHEMVHYHNEINEIKDCSGKNHNKKFKVMAEKVGLTVEKTNYGWSKTSYSDELKEYILNEIKPNELAFEYFRFIPEQNKQRKKRKKNTFKYICPICGMEIKGKSDLTIICGECNEYFVMEDIEDEDYN